MLENKVFDNLLTKVAVGFASGASRVMITDKEFIDKNHLNLLKKEGYSASVSTYPNLHIVVW